MTGKKQDLLYLLFHIFLIHILRTHVTIQNLLANKKEEKYKEIDIDNKVILAP
jgi:hypothetical protein